MFFKSKPEAFKFYKDAAVQLKAPRLKFIKKYVIILKKDFFAGALISRIFVLKMKTYSKQASWTLKIGKYCLY